MRKFCALIAVLLFSLCATCPPASAAGVLVSSTPAAGARVSKAPQSVRLTFDRPLARGDSPDVTITGPDHEKWQDGAIGVDENVADVVLKPLGPAGDYIVDYTVNLGDPSPLTGQFRFTLTKAEASTAPGETGWQTWAWLAGVVAVVAAIATTAGVLQARGRL